MAEPPEFIQYFGIELEEDDTDDEIEFDELGEAAYADEQLAADD